MVQKLTSAMNDCLSYYEKLIEQRDCAKSKLMFNLLDGEITAYVTLLNVFTKYTTLFTEKMRRDSNNASKMVENAIALKENSLIPELSLALIQQTKETHQILAQLMELDYFFYNQSIQFLLTVIKRDRGSWDNVINIFSSLITAAVDTVGLIDPRVGFLKFLSDRIDTVVNMTRQRFEAHPNLNDADKDVQLIEAHTELLWEAAAIFVTLTENMEKVLNESTSDEQTT